MNRICVFSVSFPSQDGGIAVYALEVARGLAGRGFSVMVAAGSTDPPADRAIDAGLPYPVIRFPRVRNKLANLVYRFRALVSCVRRMRPDLVLATDWYGAGSVAWALAGLLGFRYAVAAHGNEILRCRSNPILRAMCRVVMAGASQVVANSASTSELVRQIIGTDTPVITVPVGVGPALLDSLAGATELRQRLGLQARPVILSLSRLVPRKGHDRILQAMPEVIRAFPDVVWLIAGKGEYEATLRGTAKALGLEKHVVFVGYVDVSMKGAYYGLCDVYVLVPRMIEKEADVEGFGITFLEASLAGKPIVAGRSGGVPDAVVDGETGLLVDPENPAEIAAALIRLLKDPAEAKRLGENGRDRVLAGFTWDHTVAQLIDALRLDDASAPVGSATGRSGGTPAR